MITKWEILENSNEHLKTDDFLAISILMRPSKPKFLCLNEGKVDHSYIKYFVNGEEQDVSFNFLAEGNYHFVVSLYNYAEVSLNTDKSKFKFEYK